MSDKPAGAPQVTTTAKHEDGGSGRKWLLGAAAAAILLGGGYLAWKNYGADQPDRLAFNDAESYQTDGEVRRAGPLASASNGESAASARAEVSSNASETRSAPARRPATARASNESYEVVGVTPASATLDENEIVVPGARRPVWARTPTARRLSAAYPERALERGREGEVSVQCVVQENGRLDDCQRVAEYPQNAGFGRAAVRVAHMYRHAPERYDGSDAIGSPVNLRVVFRIADDNRRG